MRVLTANFSHSRLRLFLPGESVVIDFIQYFQYTWLPLVKHRRRRFSLLNPACDLNPYSNIQLVREGSTIDPIRQARGHNE